MIIIILTTTIGGIAALIWGAMMQRRAYGSGLLEVDLEDRLLAAHIAHAGRMTRGGR